MLHKDEVEAMKKYLKDTLDAKDLLALENPYVPTDPDDAYARYSEYKKNLSKGKIESSGNIYYESTNEGLQKVFGPRVDLSTIVKHRQLLEDLKEMGKSIDNEKAKYTYGLNNGFVHEYKARKPNSQAFMEGGPGGVMKNEGCSIV